MLGGMEEQVCAYYVWVCALFVRINREKLQRQRHEQSICSLQTGVGGRRSRFGGEKEKKDED